MWQDLYNKIRTMDTPDGLNSQEYKRLFANETEYTKAVKQLFVRLYHDTMDIRTSKQPNRQEISEKLLRYSEAHSEAFRASEKMFEDFSVCGTKSESEIALFNKLIDDIQNNVNEEVHLSSLFTVATKSLYSVSDKGYNFSINPNHILNIFDNFNGRLQKKEFIPINLIGQASFKESFAYRVHCFIKEYAENMSKTISNLKNKETLTQQEYQSIKDFLDMSKHIAMNGMYRIDETISDGNLKSKVSELQHECEQLLKLKSVQKEDMTNEDKKEEVVL